MAKQKKKHRIDYLMILAILFFITGIVLLLVEPYRNWKREKKIEEIMEVVESQIMLDDVEVTYVVNVNDYKVNGEDYDYYADDDEQLAEQESKMAEEEANLPDYVTLTCIAMLDIESVDIHLPVWDECSKVSLRYGAGHYEDSVLPGEVGNCTILAHHMRTKGSMFNRLDEVVIGDTIKITTQGGHEFYYDVDEILVIEAKDLINYVNGDVADNKQVTLVTCTYDDTGRKLRLLVIGHIIED